MLLQQQELNAAHSSAGRICKAEMCRLQKEKLLSCCVPHVIAGLRRANPDDRLLNMSPGASA
jgi:hypothetical protein